MHEGVSNVILVSEAVFLREALIFNVFDAGLFIKYFQHTNYGEHGTEGHIFFFLFGMFPYSWLGNYIQDN